MRRRWPRRSQGHRATICMRERWNSRKVSGARRGSFGPEARAERALADITNNTRRRKTRRAMSNTG
ncbi:putative DUF4169 domain-containing protein [Paraburkholderia kururiensis]